MEPKNLEREKRIKDWKENHKKGLKKLKWNFWIVWWILRLFL
jgi:hypothetical protein